VPWYSSNDPPDPSELHFTSLCLYTPSLALPHLCLWHNPTAFLLSNLFTSKNLWSFTTTSSLFKKELNLMIDWLIIWQPNFHSFIPFNFSLILVLVTYMSILWFLLDTLCRYTVFKWLGLRDRNCYVIKLLLSVRIVWFELMMTFIHSWLKSDKIACNLIFNDFLSRNETNSEEKSIKQNLFLKQKKNAVFSHAFFIINHDLFI